MIDAAQAAKLQWPATSDDVRGFADSWLQWSRDARCLRSGSIGFDGGKSPESAYKAKHLTRVVLIMLDSCLDSAFDHLKFSELMVWLPDEGEHCVQLANLSVAEVQQK